MPCKPSACKSCSGEGSSAYAHKQDSRELPALIAMLLTSLLCFPRSLSGGVAGFSCTKSIVIFFFLLSVYFVSLDLEDKPWSVFLEYKGSFPAEGMPPAHRVQLPGAEHPSGCQSQGAQYWDPFLTLIWWRTSSFFRWVKAQAKVCPPTGGSSVAFPVGVQGCSIKCLSLLSQSTGLTKGLMSKWAIWHQSPRLNCTALGTVGGKHFCAVPRKREWLSSGARRWLTGNRKQ